MSNVSLKNLSKTYDKTKVIINNINLEIADKEFIVLVGASGCGKSTILRMIAGLEDITSGTISIENKIVNNVHPKDRDIAFVFQSYALYPHMNVYDNIAFGLKMRKYDKKVIDEKVKEVAEILDLTQYLNRKPKQLSGGQRQRVALGRAMVRKPKVFLMDEPLSNLDAKLRIQMRSEIKKLHKKLNTTFIYVTHDQTEALTMGDRIVVLDKGVVQQVDTPDNIYSHPANVFVAGFIGQMNFINAKINNNNLEFENIQIPLNENLKSKLKDKTEIIIGIRPENMTGGDIKLKVNVDIVEMLGSEKLAYFDIQGKKCSAKLNSDCIVEKELELEIKSDSMLFFDTKTLCSCLN
jgi:multiple sugar transport system ATP-binding protein